MTFLTLLDFDFVKLLSASQCLQKSRMGNEKKINDTLSASSKSNPHVLRAEKLYQRLQIKLSGDDQIDENQEQGIHRLTTILPYLPRLAVPSLYLRHAELVAESLCSKTPKTELALKMIAELEHRVKVYRSVWRSIWDARSPATMVVVGVIVMVVSAVVIFSGIGIFIDYLESKNVETGTTPRETWFQGYAQLIYYAAIPGAFGSIASILVRIRKFASMQEWGPEADPQVLFLIGLFNPFLGMLSAFFVFCMLKGGIIGIFGTEGVNLGYAAFSFVAGFSERLAQDLVQRTHETVTGGKTKLEYKVEEQTKSDKEVR